MTCLQGHCKTRFLSEYFSEIKPEALGLGLGIPISADPIQWAFVLMKTQKTLFLYSKLLRSLLQIVAERVSIRTAPEYSNFTISPVYLKSRSTRRRSTCTKCKYPPQRVMCSFGKGSTTTTSMPQHEGESHVDWQWSWVTVNVTLEYKVNKIIWPLPSWHHVHRLLILLRSILLEVLSLRSYESHTNIHLKLSEWFIQI